MQKNRLTPTNCLHKSANVLKINDNFRLRLMLIIHKIIYNPDKLPLDTKTSITLSNDIHNRLTRNNLNIFLTSEAYCKINKIMDTASILWNNLDDKLKQIKNRKSFKEQLHENFVNSYD